MIKGNAFIGQSGGPTSVINSSLAGIIETALASSGIGEVYGMQFGIEGLKYSDGNHASPLVY